MIQPASTPGRTTRKPATRSPSAWDQDRRGDCATSTSVPSDPLIGPASAGSARRPPPPDTGTVMIDQATAAAAYDGAASSLRCWHPRGCIGREPSGAAGEHTPSMPPPLRGRYRLEGRVAAGGMGEVWRARDTLLDRIVAVKLLRPQYADSQSSRTGCAGRAGTRACCPILAWSKSMTTTMARPTACRT